MDGAVRLPDQSLEHGAHSSSGGRTVAQALALLSATNRRAARPVAKLIASAFANARQRYPDLKEEDAVIGKAVADEGPRWKRFRAAAFGRAARVLKRTTHITVELDRK